MVTTQGTTIAVNKVLKGNNRIYYGDVTVQEIYEQAKLRFVIYRPSDGAGETVNPDLFLNAVAEVGTYDTTTMVWTQTAPAVDGHIGIASYSCTEVGIYRVELLIDSELSADTDGNIARVLVSSSFQKVDSPSNLEL